MTAYSTTSIAFFTLMMAYPTTWVAFFMTVLFHFGLRQFQPFWLPRLTTMASPLHQSPHMILLNSEPHLPPDRPPCMGFHRTIDTIKSIQTMTLCQYTEPALSPCSYSLHFLNYFCLYPTFALCFPSQQHPLYSHQQAHPSIAYAGIFSFH
jgi:hypothetical protein